MEYTVSKLALELNVGKSIILRAAMNKKIIDSSFKGTSRIFTSDQKEIIKKEIAKIRGLLGENLTGHKIVHKMSENIVSIKKEWKLDGFNDLSLKRDYRFVDLFSGCGGVAVGMTMARFQPILNFDIFKEANETYEFNFKNRKKIINHEIISRSVSDVSKAIDIIKKNGPLDVIFGGFPCQGFSIAGIRSFEDPRNNLYKDMAKIVKEIKPKVVVMENVLGLLSMKDEENKYVIDDIVNLYLEMGYKIDYRVLNAADYNVPQLRKRVIIIANKIGVENMFPEPICSEDKYVSVGRAIGAMEDWSENAEKNHIFTKHGSETIKKLSKLKQGKSLYPSFSDSWKRTFENKPSSTVKENHGGVMVHYEQNRVLTPRELATLQSFPEDYIFKGNKSKQLVQIGNAVPPLLAKAIGLAVRKMLEDND